MSDSKAAKPANTADTGDAAGPTSVTGVTGAAEIGTVTGAAKAPGAPDTAKASTAPPQPEPIRLFGTSWVAHDRGYGMRRVAVAIGSLLAALAGALALGFGLMGLVRYGPGVTSLGVAGFVACAVLGFSRTWKGFTRRRPPAGHHSTSSSASSSTSLYALGFVGTLFAYFLRTFTEAPGEGLRRAEYEAARADHARRRAARSGNPAAADPRST